MQKIAYFTICSANYLAYAFTLAQSLRTVEPGCKLHVFLADRLSTDFAFPSQNIKLIPIESLEIEGLADMAFRYSILEFNTALKPLCFEHLLGSMGFDAAIYLDPDILLVNPLEHVKSALRDGASCILTPHITQGLNDGKFPDEDTFLRYGIFNLGFAAFSSSPDARAFFRWWAGKTRRDCVIALHKGIFTDQSYCNMAPCFVSNFVSLRNSAYNVAYWNLKHRRIENDNGRLMVDGELLRFVHFSGIVPDSPTIFSKYQSRYSRNNIGALQSITDSYVADLKRMDAFAGGQFSKLPYTFGSLSNGDKITDAMRAAYRKFADDLSANQNPFDLDHAPFVEMDRTYPSFDGAGVSRLCAAQWEARTDLQSRFDIHTPRGQLEYSAWASENLPRETGISGKYILPLCASQKSKLGGDVTVFESRRARKEEIFDQALTSPSFMLRNLLRRHLMGEARVRDYWRRRTDPVQMQPLVESDPIASGVDVFGYFRTESGLGQAARGFVLAMQAEKIPLSASTLSLPTGFANDVEFEDIAGADANRTALICANADSTADIFRRFGPNRLRDHYKIGHWTWELPVLPAAWAPAFDCLDEVWAPSRFVGRAIRSATTKPVRIVPYVVQESTTDTRFARRELGLSADDFIFLATFDANSFSARKNPLGAIRAFQHAFPDIRNSPAKLLVKFHGKSRGVDIRVELANLCRGDDRITLIDGVYSPRKMSNLRAACDVFVSLHRSEGFGLNIGEAMAAGKLVISTDFSGSQDFVRPDNALLIPYSMCAVAPDEYPYATGQWWAQPNHEAAVQAMRWAVGNAEKARETAERGRQNVMADYSPMAVGRVISEALAGRSTIELD